MNDLDAITIAFAKSRNGATGIWEGSAHGRTLDLLIGYGLGSTMPRGWWRAHHILIRGPMRGPAPLKIDRIERSLQDTPDGAYLTRSLRNERQRLIELHPAVGPWLASFNGWASWQERARTVAAPRVRARLERETGYSALYTREECADAVRIYPADSMGAKALLALHRSNVWKTVEAHAA